MHSKPLDQILPKRMAGTATLTRKNRVFTVRSIAGMQVADAMKAPLHQWVIGLGACLLVGSAQATGLLCPATGPSAAAPGGGAPCGLVFADEQGHISARVKLDADGDAATGIARPELRSVFAVTPKLTVKAGASSKIRSDKPATPSSSMGTTLVLREPVALVEKIESRLQWAPQGELRETRLLLRSPLEFIDKVQGSFRTRPDGLAEQTLGLAMGQSFGDAGFGKAMELRGTANVRQVADATGPDARRVSLLAEVRAAGPSSALRADPWSVFRNYVVRVRHEAGLEEATALEYERYWEMPDAGRITFHVALRDRSLETGDSAGLSWELRF